MTERIFKFSGTRGLIAALVFSIGLFPAVGNAGVFSFALSLFGKDNPVQVKQKVLVGENSQNLALLDAPLNRDPEAGRGGSEITVVGDSAILAQTGPSGSLADIKDVPQSDQISVYVVREGDTLSQIASLFGVSTNTILWANDIGPNGTINIGQKLIILPVSGVRHEVEKGETLKSIVKEYGGDLEEVMNYNSLSEDSTLKVGQTVVIPDGEIAAPVRRTAPSRSVAGGSNPSYVGYYMRPISGGVRTQGNHGYNGVDLASYVGAPIFAAADGTVIISKNSGWNGGYGLYVVIKHDNGTQTLYAHNSSNIVHPGQRVVQGQVIGYVGSTGRSTGPHVHFEVRGARNPF